MTMINIILDGCIWGLLSWCKDEELDNLALDLWHSFFWLSRESDYILKHIKLVLAKIVTGLNNINNLVTRNTSFGPAFRVGMCSRRWFGSNGRSNVRIVCQRSRFLVGRHQLFQFAFFFFHRHGGQVERKRLRDALVERQHLAMNVLSQLKT